MDKFSILSNTYDKITFIDFKSEISMTSKSNSRPHMMCQKLLIFEILSTTRVCAYLILLCIITKYVIQYLIILVTQVRELIYEVYTFYTEVL